MPVDLPSEKEAHDAGNVRGLVMNSRQTMNTRLLIAIVRFKNLFLDFDDQQRTPPRVYRRAQACGRHAPHT